MYIDYVDVGRFPLAVYIHNTVGKNGDLQPLYKKISRNGTRPWLLLTVNVKSHTLWFDSL